MPVLPLLKFLFLASGLALIGFATWFTQHVHFTPVCGFGQREVAHLFGFVGLLMATWFVLTSFSNRITRNLVCCTVLIPIGVLAAYYLGTEDVTATIGAIWAGFAIYALVFQLGLCWVLFMCAKLKPRLFEDRRGLWITVLVMLGVSWSWELVVQPLSDVYGGPPRGTLQFPQLICDLLGVWVGAYLTLRVSQIHFESPLLS